MKGLARIWRSLFGQPSGDDETGRFVELPVSTSVLSEVIVRASDDTEAKKVIGAIAQLQELWGEDEPRLWLLARAEATYPHLVTMADVEPRSQEWLTALANALGTAADSIEEIEQEQESIGELLDKFEKDRE